mgnify:CR=1 FL=1
MKTSNQIGKDGEEHCISYLIKNKYKILEQNWRYTRCEIDIIAQINNYIVFFEVKTRKSNHIIPPEISISKGQEKRIIFAANHYIKKNKIDSEVRFDIIAITHNNKSYKLKHIKDAFYPTLN